MAGPTINPNNKVNWGTDASTTYGMIQSLALGKGGTVKEYRDYQGDVAALVAYDQHDTIQLTALAPATVPTLPEKGGTFTVGGKAYRCTDASVNYANEEATSISLSGRTYPTIDRSSGGHT